MFDPARLIAALPELANGATNTVMLTFCSALLSWVVGSVIVVGLLSPVALWRRAGRVYVSFMRGTPALVQLFLVFFALPMIGVHVPPFIAASITLGLNSGAYVAEILRGALLAIPAGQIEAAEALGMRKAALWRRILLPQGIRIALPSLTNELTLLLKTTPLASVVAVTELTFAGQIVIARTFEPAEVLLAVALGYIVVSQALVLGARALERHLAVT
ncbi:MAG: polar amino acid transporter permease [Devosia sp.]|uniref:amino acid ABC transporter permease n=1 Tax=Devosia sp. TaxID=1871048 RepID=UPI00261860DF|nr:amino acid ABC transporter permease [Devosia sp.]MDB5529854.1 polar amino acid transporter permease [Devosia sp.]